MNKISIIGAGAFGFAMAWLLGEKYRKTGKEIYLYDINEDWINHIRQKRTHPIFHRQVFLDKNIKVVGPNRLEKIMDEVDLVILSVPSKFLREAVQGLAPYFNSKSIFLNLAKGIEVETGQRASEIVMKTLGANVVVGTLSGGMIAQEVTMGNPLCAEVAFVDLSVAKEVVSFLSSTSLRLDPTTDLVGVEYAGALKNIIAIGAGIFDGAGYKESSKSACISYLAGEAEKLALVLGAQRETFLPGRQAWVGDLLATCFGGSRNLEFGYLLGQGYKSREAITIMQKKNKSVEGFWTTRAMADIITEKEIEAPLFLELNRIVHQGGQGRDFIKTVMSSGVCQR